MPIEINIPGSKSILNRVLILAALCEKPIKIENAIFCEDTEAMIQGLKKLGHEIKTTNTEIYLTGKIKSQKKEIKIFTNNAGTTTRFLTALSTLKNQNIKIEGNQRMNSRPIQLLVNALNEIGANVTSINNCPPVQISPSNPTGGKIKIPGNISSQYISALMMIAPFTKNGLEIAIENEIYSTPYIKMTASIMQNFGLKSTIDENKITIKGQQKPTPPSSYTVEADASSASYFGAISALTKKEIKLNITEKSLQGDIEFLNYLKKMGCKINKNTITREGELKSLGEIDMNKTPDLVMTFAVLAMFTPGKTTITNISNLKIKETDRIEALKNEIAKFGIKVETGEDFIEITGNPELEIPEIEIETYEDHRIAMAFGILPNVKIKNPSCVNKSFPSYWQELKKIKNV
ncbi:3-phosphoshikimate 1-carboxyvinyltransferase [Candidatus Peregrinibacteria bacterium CG10_big_fil_rev_8_21_14_0_10_36_19]|nr:MAG: 3-phosphoshikimate 1-carboxyvinyltransferase [Candidatus Peregrinibacteria bacterium CG10_big_fil_rev_8_21_14_0_10_36_19]